MAMNIATAGTALDELEDDCDLRIIRLRLEGLGIEGIARSFAAADKILLGWCARFQGTVHCLFEVVSFDGTVRCGQYVLRSPGAHRPALARLLRLGDEQPAAEAAPDDGAAEPGRVVRRRIRLPAYRAGAPMASGRPA